MSGDPRDHADDVFEMGCLIVGSDDHGALVHRDGNGLSVTIGIEWEHLSTVIRGLREAQVKHTQHLN